MKIAVYNRWLSTLGGGERYSLAIASVLQEYFPVDYVSHTPVSRNVLEERFQLNLRNVRLRTVPLGSPDYLSRYTREYFLFINATQGSTLPCLAPLGVLVVYFPLPLRHPLRYRIARVLQRALLLGVSLEGFYPAARGGSERYSCGDSEVRIKMWPGRTLLRPMTVELFLEPPPGGPRPYPVTIYTSKEYSLSLRRGEVIRIREHAREGELAIRIVSPVQYSPEAGGPVGVLLHYVNIPSWRRFFLAIVAKIPIISKKLAELASLGELPTSVGLQTYREVWTISEYTRGWVERMWGRKSQLLYPPASLEGIIPRDKANWILSVGRFFAGGHNKKHEAMIRVFKELMQEGLQGWELHLAGGTMTTAGAIHKEYLERLQRLAQGYPIHFHLDVSSSQLRNLYGRAKVYWHATGFEEDPQRHPKRFEHFGITVVEAMAGGAVPVVIRGGGLPEIVRHGVDGFLWQDVEEWKRYTLQLIRNPDELARMRNSAVQRAKEFGIRRFRQNLLHLVGQLEATQ